MTSSRELRSVPITADLLHGALDFETTERGLVPCRLPAWAREKADGQLLSAQAQPAGVRLAFRTTSTSVELSAHRTYPAFRGVAPRADCHVDIVVDGRPLRQVETSGGTRMTIDPASGSVEVDEGPSQTIRIDDLPSGDKIIEIWLPHYERIELVSLRADKAVEPVAFDSRPRWVHYGSSISQGSNATAPTRTWAASVARTAGFELTNLGFSGSAMLDGFIAQVIRDLPAELISVKVGINLVNAGAVRTEELAPLLNGFLDTIREGHPKTPLVVVSALHCAIHEDNPGPAATDFGDGEIRYLATGTAEDAAAGKPTLRAAREVIGEVVAQRRAADPNLHFVDGLTLFGAEDETAYPSADRLHPPEDAHAVIADRFTTAISGLVEGAPGAPSL